MFSNSGFNSKTLALALLALPICCNPTTAFASNPGSTLGLKVETFPATGFSYFNRTRPAAFTLQGYYPAPYPTIYSGVSEIVEIESLDSFIILRQSVLDENVELPLVMTFEQYRTFMQDKTMALSQQQYMASHVVPTDEEGRGSGGINLDIPLKIKSKTFQKVFGSGTVGLTVTGDISIQAKLRREDRSEVRTALTRGASTNFNMQQKQSFAVTGKIGDKVTVNVDQNSERAFDFENNIRINYQGYDDEVIQKIEAGNISLSLPGTQYVTFSGKNAGLFGLKTEMVLGNLNVTTIASQEKGESQRISLSGGAEEGSRQLRIDNYLKDTYFFLDLSYRENFKQYDAEGNHISSGDAIDIIEVYKASPSNLTLYPDQVIGAWATFNGKVEGLTAADTVSQKSVAEFGFFLRLEKSDYFVENNLGYIRLNNPVTSNDILAVTYRTVGGEVFGGPIPGTNNRAIFKLIKSNGPQPTDGTWDLAWKNVYSLGARNIGDDGFDLRIFFRPPSGVTQENDDITGEKWVTVFGLDRKDQSGAPPGDGVIDIDNNILDLRNGEVIFLDLRPFDPEGYNLGGAPIKPDLGAKAAPRIYDSVVPSEVNQDADNFYLEIRSRNRTSEFNLGFNVIEGSEVITLNGETLQNGRDYTIDYFTGTLNILDERASDPASQLDVSFERNQLFQLEKKTILGTRAEYALGQSAFIGGTLLYLSESTLDRKVRVGRGPIRNLVWDLNTQLNFNPNFVGKVFDALPFIRAKGETTMRLEAEIAQVLPNPNTLNSPDTGDNQGVAYIDDFEGAKKTVSLGVQRRNWTLASQPFDGIHTTDNMVNYFWYNPFDQVSIKAIYPERDVSTGNVPTQTHVLTFDLYPDLSRSDVKAWGGIMRPLSAGLFDQSQTTFIEIMIQGDLGRLHLDLGTISEDIIPDGVLNTEDVGLRDGILDEGEDLGLDGFARLDPPALNHPRDDLQFLGQSIDSNPNMYDFWDINRNRIKDANEPWSYDDWFYDGNRQYLTNTPPNVRSIIGSEGNANDEGGRYSDSEDINKNGIVDRVNSYFTYSFSLDKTSPDTSLIVPGSGNPNAGEAVPGDNESRGWFLYRIPFEVDVDSLKVGNPSSTQIEYARIWLEVEDPQNFARERLRISIAEINMVGSDWKELGSTRNEFASAIIYEDTTVAVAQINTHDNPGYAATLRQIGVQGEEDRVTGVQAREQSIVLKATELAGSNGANVGVTQKSLFQPENYLNYERIRMFAYGRNHVVSPVQIPSDTSQASPLEYFLRFGADANNYYEYRSALYEEWNPAKNSMDVRLQDFTVLDRDTLIYFADSSKAIGKRGNPSLTNVKTLVIGIKNLDPTQPFTGEVWFNELRLSNVDRDKGMAMRMRANLQIADFATISGDIEKRDADFHNVAERFGNGNNSTSGSVNANVGVDKFLPASWGLNIPVSFNYRRSSSTPKYFPGRDRLVTGDLAPDELQLVRTINRQSGFNISFRRQAQSENFFVKNTIDKLSFSLGQTTSHAENPSVNFSDNTSWSGNLDYRVEFGRNNYISLLSWVPNLPLIGKVKATKFYFTPQNLAFGARGSRTEVRSQNRLQSTSTQDSVKVVETLNYTVDRTGRANMKIFENLVVDITRTHKADMRGHLLHEIFTNKPRDLNVTQNFTVRYTPTVFGWLNNSFNYTANYSLNDNIQQGRTGKSATNSVSRSADFTLRLQQLARSIFGGGDKPKTPGRGERPQPRTDPGNQLLIFQEGKKEERSGISLNPLKLFSGFISKFRDINFNYSERTNVSQFGLAAGQPSLKFQFGLSDTTNIGTVEGLATQSLNFSENRSYRAGSGLTLGRAFDVGLTYNHNEQRNETTQISGSFSDSWLNFNKFDMPFPEVTVRISGLEKIPLFNNIFRTVSLSHGFSGQRDVTWNREPDNVTQESFTTNFRPLGKLDLNFNNGITGNIQMNRSVTLSRSKAVGSGANRTTRADISLTATYAKQSGFKLPIWPFNKGELKNSIDFNLTFTKSDVVTERSIAQVDGEDQFDVQDRTNRWAFRPSLTYSFSNRVRGGAFFEVGSTDSERAGKTSVQEFGIDVNIAIRGN